jgi:hypothetical protein
MANNFPLGYNINIQSLDEQFGLVEKKEDRSEDILAVTGEELDTEQAKAVVRQSDENPYYQVFQRGYQQGKSVDELTQEAADVGIKGEEFASNPEFVAEQALTVNNYDYSAADARVATNYQIAQEIISNRQFEVATQKGPFERTLNSIDRFLREVSPIGTIEAVTAKTEQQSMEILNAAATKSPAEFRLWFEDYAENIAKEGIFAEDTLGALEALAGEVSMAGTDPTKGFNQALSALDIIGAGQLVRIGVKAVVKTSMKSSTAVGRVAAIRGAEAASEAAEKILAKSPDPEVLGNVGPSHIDVAPQPVRPSAAKFTEKFSENEIIKGIDDLWQRGAFGRIADPEAIKVAARDVAEKYTKKVSNPVFDYKLVDEGLGNYVTTIRFGKATDGTPFKPMPDGSVPQGVQKLADEISQTVEKASVAAVDPEDLSKGYVIEVSERVNVSGLPGAVDEALGIETGLVRDTVGKVMNNSIMGSSALRDNQRLATLAQMAESSRAAVKQIVDPYINSIQKLNAQERYTIQAVYTELRDGKDAALRTRYTEGEFRVKYKQMHPKGEAASPRAYEAYEALATIEEADYLLKTTTMLNRYIEKGYQNTVQVFDNYFAPAKKVRRSDVPDDARLVDGQYGGKIRLQDIEDEELPIWKLDKPTSDGQEYVVAPKQVRIIEPTDVMGYNPGGSRANPNLNYFVVIGDTRLKSLMGTFTEKQAKTAITQLRAIQNAIRGNNLTDDIIRANNDWNPSVQSVEDFAKMSADEGWDLSRGEINYKGRNDDILSTDVANSDIFTGMKLDDYVANDMRRNDRVLMDFGGGRAYNEDPVNSVLAQMGNSVFTYSNRAYARNAMVGWVKKVQQKNRSWLRTDVSPNDYETLFRTAEVSGNDEFARRMKELKDITERRLSMKDEASMFFEDMGQQIAEFVFDKTGKQLNIGDPTNFMLKVGFQSAFGFTNVSQFFMQGMHATTIMAISPKHGLKGAAMTIPVRAALRANTPDAIKLATERLAKAADIPVKDAEELIEYIRTSGRAVVDGDAIEDGTGVGFGISGWNGENMKYSALSAAGYNISKLASKGLDLGLYPFKQGERLARLTGINTAFFEFKAKFPNVSVLSDEARLWITRREQDLTFNMSSLSRGKVQSGFMRVPTQWLSYTLRSLEQVFVGRNFTAAERVRLFTALAPMYGLTGFGMATAADYIAEKAGIDADSSLYIGLKYGMLDALIDALPGDVEIGLGQRLAPVGAITDTYKKIFQEETITAIGGPSGEIAGGIFTATMDALSSLRHGHTATLTDDLVKILRQPSGLDNIGKAIGIFNNGVYRSKNGISIDSEMSIGDGIVALTGFTPLEVVENYSRMDQIFNGNKKFTDFRKEVNRDAERIFVLMQGDRADTEKAIQLMNELHARIAMSGFSASQTSSLRRAATQKLDTNWQRIQDNLLQQDKIFALQAARSILKGDE